MLFLLQNDEVCALCKDAIEAMGQYIGKHDTKQKVEAALTQLCKDVPIDVLSQKVSRCNSFFFNKNSSLFVYV